MPRTPNAQLTHVGLYVDDMDAMVAFYTSLLGLIVTDSGEFLERQLTFLSRRADEHHQLVFVAGRRAPDDIQLLSQVSFRVDDLASLRHFRDHAIELGAKGMEGRNHGNSWSIYFEDPESNRLELYAVTPWFVHQPWRVALDLDESDEVIVATTRKLLAEGADWGLAGDWETEMSRKLGQGSDG